MFGKKEKLSPQEQLIQREEKANRARIMGKVLSSFGKVIPKGIHHPDSLVRNIHLYKPIPGKHTTRLF